MQMVSVAKRTLLSLCLLATAFVFTKILSHQKKLTDAGEELAEIKKSEKVLLIPSWNAVFYFCYYGKGESTSNSCHEDPLRAAENISLPLRFFKNPMLNFEVNSTRQEKKANTVHLSFNLTAEHKEFLKKSRDWVLLLPRQSHRATYFGSDMGGEVQYGHASNVSFGISETHLKNKDTLDIIINYKGLEEFGPLDISAAVVHPEVAGRYARLFEQQLGAAALSKQLLAGLPLVMGAVAAVLDHSPAMMMLAVFGALRAVHTYFGFVSESSQLLTWELLLTHPALGASFAFLLMFLEKLFKAELRQVTAAHRVCFVLFCSLVAIGGHFIDKNWQITSTLWIDTSSAATGLLLMIAILLNRRREKSKNQKMQSTALQAEAIEQSIFSKSMTALQVLIAGVTLLLHGSVNLGELSAQLRNEPGFTDPLDWRHMFLMPALLTAGLLEVGSVAKRMLTFGHEMAEKALIEKELKVGHDVQARMLPDRKFSSELWKWHAVYHPAEALAGDWFDIREIQFENGKKLLAVCLADVTGHGVGSSLSTSVICSHWSLWCSEVGTNPFPTEAAAREGLLAMAPLRIHKGLSALRKNENCTAMMALVDPYSDEVSLCSAGHPGLLILNPSGLRYATTSGERLGGDLVGEAVWSPKTEKLTSSDLLVIYSDGIVPVGVTVLTWAGRLKKRIASGEHNFELMLMKTLHDNKRVFLGDPANEDDMTLIMLRRIAKLNP